MGAITRIRQLSPYFLAVVAVLFIVFMVVQDSSCTSIRQQGQSPENRAIAEVNGEVITEAVYERMVRDMAERMRQQNAQAVQQGQQPQELSDEQIRQQVFDQLIDEVLHKQEAEKLGLVVTEDELVDVMLVNPPPELQFFKDSTGRFQKELWQELVTNPQRYGEMLAEQGAPAEQVEQQQALWDKTLADIEKNLRVQKLQEAITAAVGAAASVPSPSFAEVDYVSNNSTADVRFIAISADQITDTTIKPSDAEMKAYYEKNKQYYIQKPARKLKYAVFKQVPSAKDSARALKQSAELMQVFSTVTDVAKRDSIFTEKMQQFGGTSKDYTLLSDVDPTASIVLQSLAKGDVFGPLNAADGIRYYRVDDRREASSPTVRASHILITFDTNKDSALAVANKILARARSGEDFGMLAMTNSKDPGSAQQQGDLGYFGKGRMVPEFEKAAFEAEVGQIVGPVESQFGYHIIKVTDRQNTEIKYSEITIAPKVSTSTKQSIISNALKMEKEITDGGVIDSVAKAYNLKVQETRFFNARSPMLGSAELTAWAFSASKGDVKRIDIERTGLVVAQLTNIREKGIKPFEDVKEDIQRTLTLRKKLDMLKSKAEQVAQACKASGTLDAAKSIDSTLEVRIQTGLRDNGQLTGFGGDYVSTNAAFKQPIGQIGSPIRGKRAWVIMVVDQRTDADMAAFKKDRAAHLRNLTSRFQQSAYYSWIQQVRENATIVDKRWERQ